MSARRPSYWEIIAAYLEEGYRAWQAREDASGKAVEDGLGLSALEGVSWHRELEGLGLIEMERAFNAIVAYRLAPHGLEVAERLPDIERVIAQQWGAIDAINGPPAEKEQAKFSLKAELLKVGVQKGADIAIAHVPSALQQLQTLFTWFTRS
jgi:hypothetical protein